MGEVLAEESTMLQDFHPMASLFSAAVDKNRKEVKEIISTVNFS